MKRQKLTQLVTRIEEAYCKDEQARSLVHKLVSELQTKDACASALTAEQFTELLLRRHTPKIGPRKV